MLHPPPPTYRFKQKLEQKALKQAKQKKSKSAEFLMAKEQEEEEGGVMKGIVNPGFLSGEEEDEQSCGRQRDGEREIGGDGQDSTLAAHQQQKNLEALASTRGNEGARNYFDPWATVEGDLRQRGMFRVGAGDELELKFMHEDERGLYEKLSQILNEDEVSTVIDLPGSFMEARPVAVAHRVPQAGWRDHLREKLEEKREEVIPHYVEQLREHVQDDMIPVGRTSLEQDECTAEEKEWARKRRVMAVLRGNTKESFSIRDMKQEEAALQDRLYAAFQRSERRLLNSLRQRQAEVIAQYGEITEITEPLGIGSDLPWQVEWTRTPQPTEVRVVCLRAVREKLSRGLYSVCVSLQSGLGGPALRWSCLKEQQWTSVTEPVEHQGRICDMELLINQNLHVVLPASCDLLPSSVLMFRLLSMPSKQCAVTAVVAWGVFPVCDCSLTLIQGRFRTPLLRGCPNSAIDQFSKIERLLSADLDNWLCNLYFQVRKLQQRDRVVPECNAYEGKNEEPPPDISTSTCSSLAGKSPVGILPVLEPASEKTKPGTQSKGGKQNQPFNKITSQSCCEGEREVRTSIITEELQHFSFSLQSQRAALLYSIVCCGPAERLRIVWRMLPAELGLSGIPRPSFSQLTLLLALIFFTWFPRLYLHYCSQWLYLHVRNVPVNRFSFHAHTVDLVYQSSLLRTLEELLLVLLGPLTLNAAMFLLLLIRWLCQLVFGSTPSFLSKLIMALGVWTVLDPLAVFTVDAVLGRLSYSAEKPVADAAKLYWHFHRLEQSGTAGILITLFLYIVLFILSFTMLYMYFLRFHNDGRILDVYLRLHSPERAFFIPDDFEVSNQELSYIVKKAEEWRGFNGERRKVAVYDYIWSQEVSGGCESPGAVVTEVGETSSHVSIYTLYLSGLRQRYRHFLRQPSGAIVELIGDLDGAAAHQNVQYQKTGQRDIDRRMKNSTNVLRERKSKNPAWRCNRVGPLTGSACEDH
ncbi:uncharacterized protein ofcc1 [Hemibagrus wyckioides]|uniref:uncharacterized protein ofcc1 n=1 Tax=Hemibagrus wyckioides TaxID=337641 RepID=UPI00266B516A|nr:uncharacterized protein ofcc1 [Hemibagrus wyckioides]